MATVATNLYSEQQEAGRFEVSCWQDGKEIAAQVLDLEARDERTTSRFLNVWFYPTGDGAEVRTDREAGGHTYRCIRHGDLWTCNCKAGMAGRMCWHRRAVRAALMFTARQRAIGEQRERRQRQQEWLAAAA